MGYNCKVMHGFDNNKEVEVSDESQSVGWNDGDIMTLTDIVNEEIGMQCIENNNIIFKQSIKITGSEKMCDVAIIFNLLKQIENKTALKDIPFYSLSFLLMLFFLS